MQCPVCKGEKTTVALVDAPRSFHGTMRVRCRACNGTGEIDPSYDAGSELDGSLYEQAKKIVVGDNNASRTNLRRKLKIGPREATAILKRLEDEGVVSAADEVGKRTVLKRTAEPLALPPAAGERPAQAAVAPNRPSAEPLTTTTHGLLKYQWGEHRSSLLQNLKTAGRWIGVLPGSFVSAWAASTLIKIGNGLSLVLDDPISRSFVEAASNIVMGAAFIWVGAKIAPDYKETVAYALMSLGFVIAGVLLFPAIIVQNYWAIFSILCLIFGLGATGFAVLRGEVKL